MSQMLASRIGAFVAGGRGEEATIRCTGRVPDQSSGSAFEGMPESAVIRLFSAVVLLAFARRHGQQDEFMPRTSYGREWQTPSRAP